ncbi:MAG TPA: hypothetical protein VK756_07830 [Solirubrobacteraceae bacterium]|jgi:hypothetical protein|nr:hypothetical protein [Solirubrobacteraceae bacterium]
MAESLEVPVMKWPFRMGGFNSSEIAYVEQDTPEEVAQCVAMVFSVEQGALVDAPKLGLPDPTFRIGGVSEATLLAVAQRWEPRAALNLTRDTIVALAQAVDVEVSDA